MMKNKLLSSLCVLTAIPVALFLARTDESEVIAESSTNEIVEALTDCESNLITLADNTEVVTTYLNHPTFDDEQEQIRNEIMYGDMELLAQLVQAEAGNQDLTGKRLVVDVVLNRVDYGFENNIESVIYYSNAFSSIDDGNFDKAAYEMTEEDYLAVEMEVFGERLDTEIVYFRTDHYSEYGTSAYQYGDHYFSTR